MLEVRSLEAGFASRAVLRQVTFSAAPGEVLGVLGPNGSGKTTLFRTLLGLLPPRGGEVLLEGKLLAQKSRSEIARLAGYVPQGHAAYFPLSVHEFVLLGRSAHRGAFAAPGSRDRDLAQAALDRLGVGLSHGCRTPHCWSAFTSAAPSLGAGLAVWATGADLLAVWDTPPIPSRRVARADSRAPRPVGIVVRGRAKRLAMRWASASRCGVGACASQTTRL